MNEPTGDGTTTFHPTIDWLSQISLHPITPVPYSKHKCGTHRTHQKIPINVDATEVLRLHHEEFEFLLVSQALPCIHSLIKGALGPTLRHTLQDLQCILSRNHYAQWRENPPLAFTIYPTIHW